MEGCFDGVSALLASTEPLGPSPSYQDELPSGVSGDNRQTIADKFRGERLISLCSGYYCQWSENEVLPSLSITSISSNVNDHLSSSSASDDKAGGGGSF